MEQVIERLRKSKAEYETEQAEAGLFSGRGWAESAAEYRELARVAALQNMGEGAAQALRKAVDPDEDYVEEDWVVILGFNEDRVAEDAFAAAFIKGAREVFESVRDLI